MASSVWQHPLSQAMRTSPGETSKAIGEYAYDLGKQGVDYAFERPFSAARKAIDFATDWSMDPRVMVAKGIFSSTPANADEDEFARQVQYGIRPAPETETLQYADGKRAGYAEGSKVLGPIAKAAEEIAKKYVQNKRVPQLQESAQRIKIGEGSAAEHADLVSQFKPVRVYDAPVAPATYDEMHAALSKDKLEQLGAPRNLPEGYPAAVRLDIPAYQNNNTWVVSVHDPKTDYSAGKVIGYDSVAHLDAPTFGVQPKGAVNIAAGKPKSTIATVQGGWKPTTPEEAHALAQNIHNDPSWAQVGMDPERHAYFYGRSSMQPVVSADEALHIGPLVYAKNPVYGNPEDYPFADGGSVYPLDDKSNWNENVDYQKTGGKLEHMSPNTFLNKTKSLNMDKDDKKSIDKFKKKIKTGKKVDPAAIYPEGGQDGRHHVAAAKKLGIKSVPVITWPKKAGGGSIVNRALVLTSKQAKRPRGRP